MTDHDRGRPILIVEDDVQSREGLLYLLESYGYSVVAAADSVEALETLRRDVAPCIILLDLTLPNGGGGAFRTAQLAHPRSAQIPVIVLSGRHDIESEAARLGATGYCGKPIDCDSLLALIDRHRLRA